MALYDPYKHERRGDLAMMAAAAIGVNVAALAIKIQVVYWIAGFGTGVAAACAMFELSLWLKARRARTTQQRERL